MQERPFSFLSTQDIQPNQAVQHTYGDRHISIQLLTVIADQIHSLTLKSRMPSPSAFLDHNKLSRPWLLACSWRAQQ